MEEGLEELEVAEEVEVLEEGEAFYLLVEEKGIAFPSSDTFAPFEAFHAM